MATFLIPLPTSDEPSVSRVVALNGVDYTLRFDWSERQGKWLFGIADASDAPIVEGLAMVPGYDFVACTAASNRPKGSLFLISDVSKPGLENLADQELFFVEDDD